MPRLVVVLTRWSRPRSMTPRSGAPPGNGPQVYCPTRTAVVGSALSMAQRALTVRPASAVAGAAGARVRTRARESMRVVAIRRIKPLRSWFPRAYPRLLIHWVGCSTPIDSMAARPGMMSAMVKPPPGRGWYAVAGTVTALGLVIATIVLVIGVRSWLDGFPDLGERFRGSDTVRVDVRAGET